MALRSLSILRPGHTLSIDAIQDHVNRSLGMLSGVATNALHQKDVVIRDLLASDLPGYSNDLWAEETGTTVGYYNTNGGDASELAVDTFLVIWGVRLMFGATRVPAQTDPGRVEPPVNGVRIRAGAAVVAQWSFYPLLDVAYGDETTVFRPAEGYTATPLILTQRTPLLIEAYNTSAAAKKWSWQLLGATAEPAGKKVKEANRVVNINWRRDKLHIPWDETQPAEDREFYGQE